MRTKLKALVSWLGEAPYTRAGWSVALIVTAFFHILVLAVHKPGADLFSLPWWVVIGECIITALVMAYFAACFLAWLGLDSGRKAEIIAANREQNRVWKNSTLFHAASVLVVFLFFGISTLSLQQALPDLILVNGEPSVDALGGYLGNLTLFGHGYEIAEYVFGANVQEARANPKYVWFWIYASLYSFYFGCVILKVIWDGLHRAFRAQLT